jgi:hypothetical protein
MKEFKNIRPFSQISSNMNKIHEFERYLYSKVVNLDTLASTNDMYILPTSTMACRPFMVRIGSRRDIPFKLILSIQNKLGALLCSLDHSSNSSDIASIWRSISAVILVFYHFNYPTQFIYHTFHSYFTIITPCTFSLSAEILTPLSVVLYQLSRYNIHDDDVDVLCELVSPPGDIMFADMPNLTSLGKSIGRSMKISNKTEMLTLSKMMYADISRTRSTTTAAAEIVCSMFVPCCAWCGKQRSRRRKLLSCSKCIDIKYCGTLCARNAWNCFHKDTCNKV